jgi:hypothetical protein
MIWIIKVVKIGLSSLLFGLLFFSCYSNGSRYILNPFQQEIASFLAMTVLPRNDYRLSGVDLSKEMRLSMARIRERTLLP